MQNVTYLAWADSPQTIDGLGSWSVDSMSLDGASGVELVSLANVTASLVPLLGVAPVLGTNFTDADERTEDKVILSYAFWQERFGAAPDVLGKRLVLGGKARTIIGVMPRGFDFPTRDVRMWLTDHVPQFVERETRGTTVSISMRFTLHNALARLKLGVTSEQAASEAVARGRGHSPVTDICQNPQRRFRRDGVPQITVTPMLDWLVKDVKPALWILVAAAILLFAAASGNVANMQLARATSRQREIAIRSAIGAGGGRLTRQLFVETSIIAIISGAFGLGLTLVLMRVLPTLMPEDFPRVHDIAVDGRVLLVVTALTIAVSVVISLLPVRMARRVNLTSTLAEDGAAPVGQSLRSPAARSRALIITSQVAIAALLLVGAALLSQSFLKLIYIDRGYQPANLLTARITHIAHGLPAALGPLSTKKSSTD
jgi:putative ABC transport system permease protein